MLINYKKMLLFCLGLSCWISAVQAQTPIDAENEWTAIESRLGDYSKYLLEGDSISLAAMYASDGMLGCEKGEAILAATGSWVRSSIQNDTRHVAFETETLNADGDLLIETGKAEGRNDAGELKYAFRYLVVWKKEDGEWKLYRDIGL